MRLHRFYIEQKIEEKKEIALTDPELIHQLLNVFRFQPADVSGRPGDKVVLFDGSGFEYECEIISINKKPARPPKGAGGEVKFKIINKKSHFAKATRDREVSLYLSLIKKSNFELAVEKCTEIGVTEIYPIISERSDPSHSAWAGQEKNILRLNKIVKEASEQSGRLILPTVFPIMSLEQAVSQVIKEGKEGVVFHTVSDSNDSPKNIPTNSLHLKKTNHSESCPNDFGRAICLFVGPEGGWTEKEMNLFKQNNFQIKSLGINILRAETAAIIAVAKTVNSL